MQSIPWILWNLSLSAIPVGLAHLWTYLMNRFSIKAKPGSKNHLPWWVWTPLIAPLSTLSV